MKTAIFGPLTLHDWLRQNIEADKQRWYIGYGILTLTGVEVVTMFRGNWSCATVGIQFS